MSTARSGELTFSRLGKNRHACAFFRDDEEAYRALMPFILDGIVCAQKAVHVLRPGQQAAHCRHLEEAGIDVAAAEESGQLELRLNTETYLVDGRFDVERMLAAFQQMASGNASSPYPLSRIVCDMDWATGAPTHHDDLIEFEARVNDVWQAHDDAVICVYRLSELTGAMLVDIVRTHPMVLIGEALHENPFYVTPREFLRSRGERGRERVPAT